MRNQMSLIPVTWLSAIWSQDETRLHSSSYAFGPLCVMDLEPVG